MWGTARDFLFFRGGVIAVSSRICAALQWSGKYFESPSIIFLRFGGDSVLDILAWAALLFRSLRRGVVHVRLAPRSRVLGGGGEGLPGGLLGFSGVIVNPGAVCHTGRGVLGLPAPVIIESTSSLCPPKNTMVCFASWPTFGDRGWRKVVMAAKYHSVWT